MSVSALTDQNPNSHVPYAIPIPIAKPGIELPLKLHHLGKRTRAPTLTSRGPATPFYHPPKMSSSNLTSSGITIPSDSETYDGNNEHSPSPPDSTSSTSSPLILYKPPTLWGLIRGAAINLLLPFVNGLMLGFGELVANEVAFRFGWSGTKVRK